MSITIIQQPHPPPPIARTFATWEDAAAALGVPPLIPSDDGQILVTWPDGRMTKHPPGDVPSIEERVEAYACHGVQSATTSGTRQQPRMRAKPRPPTSPVQ